MDPLPDGFDFSFNVSLSPDATDLTLRYSFANNSEIDYEDVIFLSFLDVEIDEDLNTYFNEYAESSGALGAGSDDPAPDGFEVDEPGFLFGDILANLQSGTLDDTNAVPEAAPEDVCMALSFDFGALAAGATATVEIQISEDGDAIGGFALTQADIDPLSTTRVTYSGRTVPTSPPGSFLRGDLDGNDLVDASDADAVIAYLFAFGPAPLDCFGQNHAETADANDNESVTVADYLALRHAVATGSSLPAPFPDCDVDPDDDRRGFDQVDPAYTVGLGEPEVSGPGGLIGRELRVPIVVSAPAVVTGVTVVLEYDGAALIPFDPFGVDPPLFESALGTVEVIVNDATHQLVLGLWAPLEGEVLLEPDPDALREVGVVSFHVADFAVVRPFSWATEATMGEITYRATVVDGSFADHHPTHIVPEADFTRGNPDNSDTIDTDDAESILDYLWHGGMVAVDCDGEESLDAADANDNESVTVADYLALRAAVAGDAELPFPSVGCGVDPDDDTRGFDEVDTEYAVSAGDLWVEPPTGAEDRDLFVPVEVEAPGEVTALTLILEYDAGSLAPFDPAQGDPPPFESALGTAHVLVDEPEGRTGRLIIGLWAQPGATLFVGTPGEPRIAGTLAFNISDFAIVRPLVWLTAGEAGGLTYKATVVDAEFVDHRPATREPEFAFVRGNSNNDTVIDISDAVYTLSFLFSGGPMPSCMDAADANNDGVADISDPVYTLSFLFTGGPILPDPYPQCGFDTAGFDLLGCGPCACPPYQEGDPCAEP